MSYLFDSSSIFRAIRRDKVEALEGNSTVGLARYELGNILWKEHKLKHKLTAEESLRLVPLIKRTLSTMTVLDVNCQEEEIVRVANRLNTSFYDASYAFVTREKNLTLVSEDDNLIRKTKGYVRAVRLNEVISNGC